MTDKEHGAVAAAGISTERKKTEANKTIEITTVGRIRTKKVTVFRPLELHGNKIAHDISRIVQIQTAFNT